MTSNNPNYAEISDEKPFPKIKPIFTLDKNLPKVNNIIITDRLFGQCNVCLLYYKNCFLLINVGIIYTKNAWRPGLKSSGYARYASKISPRYLKNK